MELLIIFVVISFLIGTISFALPSKSSKEISELRLNASRLGLKIIPSNIGKNSFKNRDVNLMIYSLKNETNLKEAHFIRDKDELILYSPLKLKYSEAYDGLEMTLNDLPYEVVEIIFTPSSISFLWNEKGGLAILNKVSETTNSIEL